MEPRFTSPFEREPGVIARLLERSYAALLTAEPELWEPERERWQEADRNVFERPDTVGACTRLTWWRGELAGFFSFDPRPAPEYGEIGHHCVVPELRGRGLGAQQIREALRLLEE